MRQSEESLQTKEVKQLFSLMYECAYNVIYVEIKEDIGIFSEFYYTC